MRVNTSFSDLVKIEDVMSKVKKKKVKKTKNKNIKNVQQSRVKTIPK